MKNLTATFIWIDAERAVVCRWDGESTSLATLESDVPAHHRSTGHVRHDPGIRHGGGGAVQDAGEPHRLEHLRGFLADVARHVAPDDPLEVSGPGTVHERLVALIGADDREAGRTRPIRSVPSGSLTERQIRARTEELAGVVVPRIGLRTG
ncbi:MAG: hypothetical protein ACHQ15_03790 [Candidatus Limnocylindrales bacterium]